jgi:excisionase family DNA binding protein
MEKLYTVAEIADRLHKSEISVSRWMRSGELEYIRVSERRRLVSENQLEEFLNKRISKSPKKRVDQTITIDDSSGSSLKTENEGKLDVKSLRKEISLLCRSN